MGAVDLRKVTVSDASDFEADLEVIGEEHFGYRILRVQSSVIANTIAAILMDIREPEQCHTPISVGPKATPSSTSSDS